MYRNDKPTTCAQITHFAARTVFYLYSRHSSYLPVGTYTRVHWRLRSRQTNMRSPMTLLTASVWLQQTISNFHKT